MLGSQNIEKYSMFPEKVENVLTEMEQFVASADKFNVAGSDDLYTLFQDSINPETKALVAQVRNFFISNSIAYLWISIFVHFLLRFYKESKMWR